jgi:hypothetical protein
LWKEVVIRFDLNNLLITLLDDDLGAGIFDGYGLKGTGIPCFRLDIAGARDATAKSAAPDQRTRGSYQGDENEQRYEKEYFFIHDCVSFHTSTLC